MKRICFLYTDITTTGGIEKCISVISNKLTEDERYDISVISLKKTASEPFFYFNEKINIEYINKKKAKSRIETIKKLREKLKDKKIDVLVTANVALDIVAIPAIFNTGIKLISWEHFGFDDSMSNKRIDLARKLATKFSDYIVTLTQYDMKKYKEKYHFFKKVKIEQIYNHIDNVNYRHLIKETKTILTIGHFLPVKGYDILINVAKNILANRKDWKWIIIGDGEEKQKFIEEIENNGLQEQIIVKSKIKNVGEYYKNSEIYVNTSRSEGFPLTVLEAKSYNLPVVAFEIPGLVELVEDKINGLLIQPYSEAEMQKALIELMENRDKRLQYSKNAQKDVQRFNIENIIKKWKKIL